MRVVKLPLENYNDGADNGGSRDNTEVKELALHAADTDSILGTTYGPLSIVRNDT